MFYSIIHTIKLGFWMENFQWSWTLFCAVRLCYLTIFILEPEPDLLSHHENNVFQVFINLGLLKQIYGANYTHSRGQKEHEKLYILPASHLCLQIKKKKSGWWTDRDFPYKNT